MCKYTDMAYTQIKQNIAEIYDAHSFAQYNIFKHTIP